jgi:GT2 family glycosyltransferase
MLGQIATLMSQLKIAAVVVTFNRLHLLKECVDSIRRQTRTLDEIIVVNNSSTDGTIEWLNRQKDLTVITQENMGSAGGQYTGIKTAFEKRHDWIWCMDDDTEPFNDALEKLIPKMPSQTLSATAGTVLNDKGNIFIEHRGNFALNKINTSILQRPVPDTSYYHGDVQRIDFASFVGILINRKAIERIGFPNEDLFIYHDDVEYCLRLKSVGEMLLIPESKIIHKENSKETYSIQKRFLWKSSYRIPLQLEWKTYFRKRNYVWLCRKYVVNKYYCYGSITVSFLIYLRRILLYDDYKLKRIKILCRAYRDGFENILDNQGARRLISVSSASQPLTNDANHRSSCV